MNRTVRVFVALMLCAIASGNVGAQQMIYVVRHGEKLDDSKDPPLSLTGEVRAAKLAQMLAASGVKTIYTTQYRRTSQLAAPLASALSLTAIVHPAGDTPGLLKKITAHGANDNVLVVGHSNTVPAILNGLGHVGEVKIEETDFDNLFVVVPKQQGAPVLVRLKY